MFRSLATVCVALLPFAAQAQIYSAINHLEVRALTATDFEVIESRGEGARGIWCAASSYVLDRLGGSPDGRLYVKVPRGPAQTVPGRKGVTFTINPTPEMRQTPRGYSVTVRQVGESLPVQHAQIFCTDYILELREGF